MPTKLLRLGYKPSFLRLLFLAASSSSSFPLCQSFTSAAIFGRPSRIFTNNNDNNKDYEPQTRRMSAKLDSPSAQRNKEPIWSILETKVLPALPSREEESSSPILRVLEIAAGCGVHSHYFSLQMMNIIKKSTSTTSSSFEWYPSDPDPTSRNSIQAYLDDEPSLKGSLVPPIEIVLCEKGIMGKNNHDDSSSSSSTVIRSIPKGIQFDFMICINMIHISPWGATLGLMKVATRNLVEGGILYLYGPYKINGQAVESNLRFDQSLQSRNPAWGVRNLEDVLEEAKKQGLEHIETIEMPANNLSIILQKKNKKDDT